ncbi:MAG: LysE family translocator [Pseudomonadota bacterium]
MGDITNIIYFIVASFLFTIAPGPDMIFLVTQTFTHGPRAGVPTAVGLTCGNLIHTLAAVLGVSLIFQTSELAFDIVKVLGACYLLYLAYEIIFKQNTSSSKSKNLTKHSLVVRGMLMNVLNPKVMLFYIAFLPQFVSPNSQQIELEMLFFGVLFSIIVLITFGSIGLFAGYFRNITPNKLLTTPSFKWILAIIYMLLATRLVFESI